MQDALIARQDMILTLNAAASEELLRQIIVAFGLEIDVAGSATSLRDRIADIVTLTDTAGKLADLAAFVDALQLPDEPGSVPRTVNVPFGLLSDYFVGREAVPRTLHTS